MRSILSSNSLFQFCMYLYQYNNSITDDIKHNSIIALSCTTSQVIINIHVKMFKLNKKEKSGIMNGVTSVPLLLDT